MLHRLSFVLVFVFFAGAAAQAGDEEYSRLARISYIDGHVSFQHSGDPDWAAASINMALQPADRIYTGPDGRAEIEFDDGSVLRLAEKTDVEFLALRDEIMQVRILVGLATLTVQSGADFEINTPAAAFSTLRKGLYRFDVAENGDSDGIVRKGQLQAASDRFSERAESGELIHATAGENSTAVLSRYDGRDQWDEWNDRRDAEMKAYASRRYLPESVQMGVRDLDLNGRWVDVEYGPAWVPSYVGADWSPYWEGRWVYRPLWGWTWVSYEPWGWLPYHYGRWYRSTSVGWCWLPGASFGFNFWSPGLVRFYHGPSWVSWCPLGPGDYYNVNNYYYRRAYGYQLNHLAVLHRRSPDDLFNRHVRGAFRTAGTDHFLNSSFGNMRRVPPVAGVDQPWRRGSMVTDRLGLAPAARSYAPAPERPVIRPTNVQARPVVVRTEPSVRPGAGDTFLRITNPAARTDGTPSASPRVYTLPASPRTDRAPAPSIWNRRLPENVTSAPDSAGRTLSNPQAPTTEPGRIFGRQAPAGRVDSEGGRTAAPSTPRVIVRPIGPDRDGTQPCLESPSQSTPRYEPPRYERPPLPQRREPEQTRPEPNARRPQMESSSGYIPRGYSAPEARSLDGQGPAVRQESRPAGSIMRFPDRRQWQQTAPPSSPPAWGRSGGGDSPTRSMQRAQPGGPSYRPAPSAPPSRSAPSGGGSSIMRRRDR